MSTTVSILAEIPEDLHTSLKCYLDGNPDWDQDRAFSAALSLFLLQNGQSCTADVSRNYPHKSRVYLGSLLKGMA